MKSLLLHHETAVIALLPFMRKTIIHLLEGTLALLGFGACNTPCEYGPPPVLYGPPVDSVEVQPDDPSNAPDLYGPKLAPYDSDITDDIE